MMLGTSFTAGMMKPRIPSVWCTRSTMSVVGSQLKRRIVLAEASNEDDEDVPLLMEDWRAFRAKLVSDTTSPDLGVWTNRTTEANMSLLKAQNPQLAQEDFWAHPASLERGSLIVASSNAPMIAGQHLWQAAVFLIEHASTGSAGFILNRPTSLTMGEIGRLYPNSIPAGLSEALADNRLYNGGQDAQQFVAVLHGYPALNDPEVVPGIYYGTPESAVKGVLELGLPAIGFKFYAGLTVWEAGGLEREMAQGGWYSASVSRPVILKQVLQLPVPFWVEVMKLMGGEYALEAQKTYEEQQD